MVPGISPGTIPLFMEGNEMEELLEIYGGEVPEEIADLYDEVLNLYHKKANGPLDLQTSCLVAVLATRLMPSTKPTKKTEKAAV